MYGLADQSFKEKNGYFLKWCPLWGVRGAATVCARAAADDLRGVVSKRNRVRYLNLP